MHKKQLQRQYQKDILKFMKIFPATAVLGPRQCGKSTLAKKIGENIKNFEYWDLENYQDREVIKKDYLFFFESRKEKCICLDEIQKLPEIFSVLRGVIDKDRRPGKLLILGSASPELLKQSSESLAGRIGYVKMTPFALDEIIENKYSYSDILLRHWSRGGFPDSFLAQDDEASFVWRESFIKTFFERDIRDFTNFSPEKVRRLFLLLAHYNGSILNYSEMGENVGVTVNTIKEYIEFLEQTYLIRLLCPHSSSLKRRTIKSPKLYIKDTGILHFLLSIKNEKDLQAGIFSQLTNSFEGYAIENIISQFSQCQASYYRDSNGNEIDLVLENGFKKKVAIEIKSSVPKFSKSFFSALEDIKPNKTYIAIPSFEKSLTEIKKDIWIGTIPAVINDIKRLGFLA